MDSCSNILLQKSQKNLNMQIERWLLKSQKEMQNNVYCYWCSEKTNGLTTKAIQVSMTHKWVNKFMVTNI